MASTTARQLIAKANRVNLIFHLNFIEVLRIQKRNITTCINLSAKKLTIGKALGGAPTAKKRFPVETDPHKLVNFVCGLNFVKGSPEIPLKPDEEYPDWLWTLRLGNKPTLDELDPNTVEYWERLFELDKERGYRLSRSVKRERLRVNDLDKLKQLKSIRFRALAGHSYNIGV